MTSGCRQRPDAGGERGIWHGRFWAHTIRDEVDSPRQFAYVHISAVKHGLVSRAWDWPFSAFHRDVHVGSLPEGWAGDDVPGAAEQRRDPE